MDYPLGYFLTWTTYGTWLPGDDRGWVDGKTHEIHFVPAPDRELSAQTVMSEQPITLVPAQRELVDRTIRDHCRIRAWELHAVNVRTNHVHVVLTADRSPDVVMEQFKAWGTRRLKAGDPRRRKWWTENGSKRYLWTEEALEAAIAYVRDCQ